MSELPPWRSPLARAVHRNRSVPHVKFVQLATMDLDGKPRNRTIVFRGWVDSSQQLKFVTDQRSEKIPQLQQHQWVEVCWYFTKSREQFRISGTMKIVDHQSQSTKESDLRTQSWQQLSSKAQAQFYWPSPGQKRSPISAFEGIEPATTPPNNFSLLLLTPQKVEHLQLRGEPQNRTLYQLEDSEWIKSELNP